MTISTAYYFDFINLMNVLGSNTRKQGNNVEQINTSLSFYKANSLCSWPHGKQKVQNPKSAGGFLLSDKYVCME